MGSLFHDLTVGLNFGFLILLLFFFLFIVWFENDFIFVEFC